MSADVQLNHQVPVRTMPPHPLGSPGPDAIAVAEMAAKAGALGLERGAITKMMTKLQNAAYEAGMANVDALLDEVLSVVQARLNRVLQDVRALQEQAVAQPLGVVELVLNRPRVQPTVSLVARNEVINLITQAMVEKPNG